MAVYIISKDGKPLMPTTRYGHVRWLLKQKKARVVGTDPFVISAGNDGITCKQKTSSTQKAKYPQKESGEAQVAMDRAEPITLPPSQCRHSTTVSILASQAEDAGSIPVACSRKT